MLLNKTLNLSKFREHLSNDKLILEILKNSPCPLPLNFIASLASLQKNHTYRILVCLEKYGFVKKSTVQKASFYTLKSEENGK